MGTEVEQERTNVSIQRKKYDQQLKEINDTLKVKENALCELNEQNNNLKNDLSNAKEEIEKTQNDTNTHIANQKDFIDKLQVELNQERTNISSLSENYDHQVKDINDTLKEKEMSLNQLNEQNSILKTEIFNAKEQIEKAKADESTRIATQEDLFSKLQIELDQERSNVSSQRDRFDQQLK